MTLSYKQALDYIHSFDDPYLAAIRNHGRQTWGQERIRERLGELGDPHLAYPTIHVAGTKGKGSTCAFIVQMLQEAGYKTGLYVSPHLEDWRERIQVNRENIPATMLAKLADDYQNVTSTVDGLSAFEVATALAFWHFARVECDVAVIEVGLGGRLDATTVVEPIVSVITNISLDHTQLLGDTLAQIAAEKAAILKWQTPAISGPQQPEALEVIEHRASELNSTLMLVGRDWHSTTSKQGWEGSDIEIGRNGEMRPYHIRLPGEFQVENATVAMTAIEAISQAGLPVSEEARVRALATTRWPGRLELIANHPKIILDGAHNPYSIRRLVDELRTLNSFDQLTIIFGAMADKNTLEMLRMFLPICARLILTKTDQPRAAEPEHLKKQAMDLASQAGDLWEVPVQIDVCDTLAEALDRGISGLLPDNGLCITGSLALAGDARTLLREHALTRSHFAHLQPANS